VGQYIVDFCAPRARLIIEVDGRPHRDPGNMDAARTAFLAAPGYRVLRFWNSRVIDDIDDVVREISKFLEP